MNTFQRGKCRGPNFFIFLCVRVYDWPFCFYIFVHHFDQHHDCHQGSIFSHLIFCNLFLLSSAWSVLQTLPVPFLIRQTATHSRLPPISQRSTNMNQTTPQATRHWDPETVHRNRGEMTKPQTAVSMTCQHLRVPWGHRREALLLSLRSREGFWEEAIFEHCLESWAGGWQAGKGIRCRVEALGGGGWWKAERQTHIDWPCAVHQGPCWVLRRQRWVG